MSLSDIYIYLYLKINIVLENDWIVPVWLFWHKHVIHFPSFTHFDVYEQDIRTSVTQEVNKHAENPTCDGLGASFFSP